MVNDEESDGDSENAVAEHLDALRALVVFVAVAAEAHSVSLAPTCKPQGERLRAQPVYGFA
jgi:hypothetical protein